MIPPTTRTTADDARPHAPAPPGPPPGPRTFRDRVADPTPRGRALTAFAVAATAVAVILISAWSQERDLIPKFHDEHMHLLQMRHLAHGRLWLPALPREIAGHFETFHVFVEQVYASIYFPGAALAYVPAVWLKLPHWALPLLVAGACAGLLYRVVAELLDDGVSGLLAAVLLVSLQWFRYLAMMVMSHSVMLLLGLLLVWAYLRWRGDKRPRWALLMGALAGWAAITRPVDALVYAIPIAVAVLIDLRRLPRRQAARAVACAIASALPFLSLQLVQNVGITGHPFKTAYRHYADLYTPQMSLGFHRFDPRVRPRTDLPQRQDYYDEFTLPAARAHRPANILPTLVYERLPLLARVTVPNRLLWILAPLGAAAAVRSRDRAVLASVLVVFIAFYSMFAYLLPWYGVVVAPAVILLVLLGKRVIEDLCGPRRRRLVGGVLSAGVVAAAVTALPGVDPEAIDDGYLAPVMWFSYVRAPEAVWAPAIILFRYRTGDNINEEPVYNVDAMTPDDAPIIRAHDLGLARNRALFDYYARRQPHRNVYLYDRATQTLSALGNVAELAARFPLVPPATAATETATTMTTRPAPSSPPG